MRNLKIIKKFSCVLGLFIAVATFATYSNSLAYASETGISDYKSVAESAVKADECSIAKTFENKKVSTYDYLYNLDDSADYISVEFEGEGYAIFSRNTLEMMEYSLYGKSPFAGVEGKKYYAGPASYLKKSENSFENVATGELIEVTPSEAQKFSRLTRSNINNIKTDKVIDSLTDNLGEDIKRVNSLFSLQGSYESPVYDQDKLIIAKDYGTYIINKQYFYADPIIGANAENGIYGNGNSGTCGPIAAQILLSYNNYCVDRRIIPDRFLCGYDDEIKKVKYPEQNPNKCANPAKMDFYTTGTRSEATGTNSFYNEMITRIMPPNTKGASLEKVKNGVNSYLSERLPNGSYSLYSEVNSNWWGLNVWAVDSAKIKAEIDADRPLIISLSAKLGASNHMVVGYGYQDYTFYDDNENPLGTFSGYVVHSGWESENRIWINSSWCDGYLTLQINHKHNYVDKGTFKYEENGETKQSYNRESKCTECGHRTDAYIKINADTKYTERLAEWKYFYKDFYLEFEEDGYQVFQTFGNYDTAILLYDEKDRLLTLDRISGNNENALLDFNVKANTVYRLRIECEDGKNGKIKVAIASSDREIVAYDQIQGVNGTAYEYSWIFKVKRVKFICFTPSSSGTYRFKMFTNTGSDTYLYLIDPTVTTKCLEDDDSGGDSQAMIETGLVAGRRYLLIASTYDITFEREDEGTEGIGITISKIS